MLMVRIIARAVGAIALVFALGAQAEKPTVAVFDFDIGNTETAEVQISTQDGSERHRVERSRTTSLLTNKLITKLTNSGAVAVVEREKMHQIMQEVQLTQADLTDPGHATRVGKLLGADYMVFGSITLVEPGVTIRELPYGAGRQKVTAMTVGGTMRLVRTETGRIEAAADLQASKSAKQMHPENLSRRVPQHFQDAVYSKLVDKLAAKVINNLSPIKVAQQSGDTLYLTRAGLDEGRRYEVVRLGEVIKHPDTGAVLGQEEERIASIKITAGLKGMSKATVTEWVASEQHVPPGSICRPLE